MSQFAQCVVMNHLALFGWVFPAWTGSWDAGFQRLVACSLSRCSHAPTASPVGNGFGIHFHAAWLARATKRPLPMSSTFKMSSTAASPRCPDSQNGLVWRPAASQLPEASSDLVQHTLMNFFAFFYNLADLLAQTMICCSQAGNHRVRTGGLVPNSAREGTTYRNQP